MFVWGHDHNTNTAKGREVLTVYTIFICICRHKQQAISNNIASQQTNKLIASKKKSKAPVRLQNLAMLYY